MYRPTITQLFENREGAWLTGPGQVMKFGLRITLPVSITGKDVLCREQSNFKFLLNQRDFKYSTHLEFGTAENEFSFC